MGIKQLTSYVKDNYSILYTNEFYLRGQKLVFDGGALYYGLIRNCDKRFGGDYFHIYWIFKSFFIKLKEFGVTPYIVLDGGSNIPLKNNTISERFDRDVKALRNLSNMKMGQYNLPKPRLLKYLLIEVLIELQINYVLAKGEADMLVADLANRLECPLVSGDSDFFVVHIVHGVIPVDSLLHLKPNTNKCATYRLPVMAQHLNVPEVLLPMIAVIMGNDYSNETFLDKMQMHCGAKTPTGSLLQVHDRVKHISSYLSRYRSIEGVLTDLCGGDDKLTNHVKTVLREFDLNTFTDESNELFPILNNVSSFSEKILPLMRYDVPMDSFLKHFVYNGLGNPCVLDIYYHSTHFVRPQCDNPSQKASSEASEKLRTYLYVLLLHQKTFSHEAKVSEFKRKGNGYGETCIQVSIPEWRGYYPVDMLTGGNYNKMEKINVLCNLTGFPVEPLRAISEDDQVFLISVRYWIQQSADSGCHLKVEYLQALIICYIHLKSDQHLTQCSYLDLDAAHHYSRWQSIMFYLILLNAVFRYPLLSPRVSKVFQGNHVHHLYQLLDSGTDVYTLLASKNDGEIFDVFMNSVTVNMTSTCLLYKRNNLKRGRNGPSGPTNAFRQQRPSGPNNAFRQQRHGNRFALLRK